jgi:FkbM family methyltransferase
VSHTLAFVDPRYLANHVRIARRLEPGSLFLWREVIRREPVLRAYRLRATGQTVHLRHRTPDLGGLTEVYIQGNYEFPERIARVVGSVGAPLRAVDLGANIGLFGLRLLAHRPDARIIALEPDQQNAAVLRATISSSGSDGWSLVQACAATADGTVLFRQGQFLESRIADEGDAVRAVDVFPLLATADLIKIDIEGAERPILEDERFATLDAHVLYLEYHPPHPREVITRLITAAGYTIEPFEERLPGVGELWAWK